MRTFRTLERPAWYHPCLRTRETCRAGYKQHPAFSSYHVLPRPNRRPSLPLPLVRARLFSVTKSLPEPTSSVEKKAISRDRFIVRSPFQLTTVRSLTQENNHDTVQLIDLLNDESIYELWSFNYLHDLKFMMKHLPKKTRTLTKVNIVHGFWHEQNVERVALERQAENYVNVTLHKAFMPEMYGSHNSKMLILLRYNGTAQIIIHTANMIPKDWCNMTNAVWVSPKLPRYVYSHYDPLPDAGEGGKPGSGLRFKFDLLNYLKAYNARWDVCRELIKELAEHDFSSVRAALVASVPGRHAVEPRNGFHTRWGWSGLCKVLKSVPARTTESTEIVIQSPYIPAIGSNDQWLEFILDKFSCTRYSPLLLFPFIRHSKVEGQPDPKFKIIFPTPDEIRQSQDGYQSGESIYMRTESIRAREQLEYLRPLLHHWANDTEKGVLNKPIDEERFSPHAPLITDKDAGRKRAAPHLRTYTRFRGITGGTRGERPTIDWALLTSASLSKQSWGSFLNKQDRLQITSWEIGVMVWPNLFIPPLAAKGPRWHRSVEMVATFKTDWPTVEDEKEEEEDGKEGDEVEEEEEDEGEEEEEEEEEEGEEEYEEGEEPENAGEEEGQDGQDGKRRMWRKKERRVHTVGLRMPYSLPLQRYARSEMPWSLELPQTEPDVHGNTWEGVEQARNGRLDIRKSKYGNVYH
ncbi:tyrosyl-DNA phosphodiesterase-domain-containing protein [Biscogniauxia sp. FL1348]|nr:tyrosyl-DNA phosphodiesterase-domain-containing protein [Biscogniauxia sp. FL1348]